MNFNELPEFKRELKQLHKKYKSLPDDLQTRSATRYLVTPIVKSKNFAVVAQTDTTLIVKARLFCRYLKGSSLRIIYSWNEQEQRIEFIQLYFKGDKTNEDRERIKNYLKNNPPPGPFDCSGTV